MATILVIHTTKVDPRSGRSRIVKGRPVTQEIRHFINPDQVVTVTGDIWWVKPNPKKLHHGERGADYISVR